MHSPDILSSRDLLSCMELGKALTAELDSDKLYKTILNKLSDLIPAKNWSLLLLDRDTGELSFSVCVGIEEETVKQIKLGRGEGVAGQVALSQKPVIVEDVTQCDFFTDKIDSLTGYNTCSIMCVPLIFGGQTVGVLEAINPYDIGDRALALMTLIADYAAIAVENNRRYEYIQRLVNQDNLTGLYNTRYLYSSLSELIESGKKDNTIFSLIFMDLDNFKNIVDTHGHLNGSRAIQEVADTITKQIEKPAYGVSYAGDEFVIVLPGYSKKQAISKAEEMRAYMKDIAFLQEKGLSVKIYASFGVASFPDDSTDLAGLLGFADKAMFSIKASGKNAVSGKS